MTFATRPNSWIGWDADATTTLTYAARTTPSPITASVAKTDPSKVGLQFVITNATGSTQHVRTIDISIAVGEGATFLTFVSTGIGTYVSNTTDWSFSQLAGTGRFELRPAVGPSMPIAPRASVVVEIYDIQANLTPGTSIVTVGESLMSGSDSTSFAITTFPYGFHFDSLCAATKSGSSLVPVAQIALNARVILTWNGSIGDPDAYTIAFSDLVEGQRLVKPTKVGEWLSPPLRADTVFTLWVETTIAGGAPLIVSMSISVAVRNPELVATAVKTDRAAISGDATIDGRLTATKKPAEFDSVSCGDLTVAKALVVEGDVRFKGKVTFDQPVVFEQGATFHSGATFETKPGQPIQNVRIGDRTNLVFGNTWYLFAGQGNGPFYIMNADQNQFVFNNNGDLAGGGKNFLKSGNTFRIRTLAGVPQNDTLAYNSDKDWRVQAQWWELTAKTRDACKIEISDFPVS